MGGIGFQTQFLELFGKNGHPLVVVLDLGLDFIRIFDDCFRSRSRHQADVPGQKHAIEGGNHLFGAQYKSKADTGKPVGFGESHRKENMWVFLDQRGLGGHVRIVIQIGFIHTQGNTGLAETLEIRVINENTGGVVGVDDENQFGSVVDGI